MEDKDFTINNTSVFDNEDTENQNHQADKNSNNNPDGYYISRGKQWAGTVKGDANSLASAINAIFGQICTHLKQDVTKTATKKKSLEAQKNNLEGTNKTLTEKIGQKKNELDNKDKDIKQKQEQLNDIISGKLLGDRDAKITLIISAVILLGITIYLFMFYSSTAYSAFFKNWENATSIMEAMLDPNCIQNALHSGFIEFVFILFLPLLFMGLGFTVHQINKTTNDKRMSILKTVALYTLTFAFDCLLAYKISSSLYQVIVVDPSPVAVPPFTFGMAANNVDFWTVIFCGFVAYVIWGLVFSAFMNAYDKLFNRKTQIEIINKDIKKLNDDRDKIQTEFNQLTSQFNQNEADIKTISNTLGNTYIITWPDVKQRFDKFFAGWNATMVFLGKSKTECEEAKQIYRNEIKTIHDKHFDDHSDISSQDK
ncbi:MAG: hypothetical protein LKE30_00460 [Bacteroidales bacterium]|jgi:uncharacterized membrane protein|nr:hypothetical protein [Bacteroidales bacterium]